MNSDPDSSFPALPEQNRTPSRDEHHQSNNVYITLGSNIEPESNLPAAVSLLKQTGDVVKVSSVYESDPVGNPDDPQFLNAALLWKTTLKPQKLKEHLLAIEQQLNRVRDPHDPNSPRTIDLDLALYNREVFELGQRTVPDPDILVRPFVAIPLAEIDPDYVHPVVGTTLQAIAEGLSHNATALTIRHDISLSEGT